MNWINALLDLPSALQAVALLSLLCALGLALGKIRICGISLGVAFVFFVGIMAGTLGFTIDAGMLSYCETFGLVLFVYALGLHVGPNFFGSFVHEGTSQNLWSMGVVGVGTLMALALTYISGIPMKEMIGILCGATTNTPALGAAQQALAHAHIESGSAALATAVSYPLGVLGVILAILLMRKLFVRPEDLEVKDANEGDLTYIGQYEVVNPAIVGKNVADVAHGSHAKFIISRLWRGKEVIVPIATTILQKGDNLLIVTNRNEKATMEMLFGKKIEKDWNREKINWNDIDANMESRTIILTRRSLNGKLLGQLKLRDAYDVNVSRIRRSDIKLLATDNLRLRYGDRLTVVGEPAALDHAEQFLGNSGKRLNEPNIANIFLGMLLGLAVGTIPISLPGMDTPIRLGIAGGPIIMGILMGAFGPRLHLVSYTTSSASLMLRKLGLSLYLACLGLDAGKGFLSTVLRPEGLLWIGIGFLLTLLPVVIVGFVALKLKKFDYGTLCGIICGAMANPMALDYANDTIKGDRASVSYATVYPLGMFVRVIIAQVLVMFFV